MQNTRNLTLRALVPGEVPLLRRPMEKLAEYHNKVAAGFRGMYPTMPIDTHLAHMEEHLRNDTARIIGLFLADGTLGGFGMASHESGYGEIDYLFVDENIRGKSHGGKILKQLHAYLKEKGVRFVDLQVVIGNPAKQFYEKHGFAPRSETLSKRI